MVYQVFGVFLGKIIIQAIDFNGGGYRNRTGVHGFAIAAHLQNRQYLLALMLPKHTLGTHLCTKISSLFQ